MAEEVVGASHPQVFVVDSQARYSPLPSGRTPWWPRITRRILHLFVALALLGVFIEGCFIYYLYSRTGQESADVMHHIGPQAEMRGGRWFGPRPSAHLRGRTRKPARTEDNILLWEHEADRTFTNDMGYANGSLLVRKDGYYYIYSKVHISAKEKYSLFKHMVMIRTKSYDAPLELMTSIRSYGWPQRESHGSTERYEVLNGFLGGVFHLIAGDAIFVKLEGNLHDDRPFSKDFMGAFMV